MTREQVKKIFPEISDEQLKEVLDLNSADIGKAKADAEALRAGVKAAEDSAAAAKAELLSFKAQAEAAEQMRTAAADRDRKHADFIARFDGLDLTKYGSGWYNEPTRAAYLSKFTAALESADSADSTDADILHELVKNDSTAFARHVTMFEHRGAQCAETDGESLHDYILSQINLQKEN